MCSGPVDEGQRKGAVSASDKPVTRAPVPGPSPAAACGNTDADRRQGAGKQPAAPTATAPVPGGLLQFQAAGLQARLAQVTATGWPPLRAVRLSTGPIVCSVGTAGVRLATSVALVAELSEEAANAALRRLPPGSVRQLHLVCRPQGLEVHGRYQVRRWLALGFSARGQLAVDAAGQVTVALERLDLAGVSLPARARQVVTARLQQRVRVLLGTLPLPAGFRLQGIQTVSGCLLLRASWEGEGAWLT